MHIGKQLKKRRKQLGLRQVDVAKRVAITPNYLSNIEQGIRDPSSHLLNRLSIVLRLSLLTPIDSYKDKVPGIEAMEQSIAETLGRELYLFPNSKETSKKLAKSIINDLDLHCEQLESL